MSDVLRIGAGAVLALAAGATPAFAVAVDFDGGVTELEGDAPAGLAIGDAVEGEVIFDATLTGTRDGDAYTYVDPEGSLEVEWGDEVEVELESDGGVRLTQYADAGGSFLLIEADGAAAGGIGATALSVTFRLLNAFDPDAGGELPAALDATTVDLAYVGEGDVRDVDAAGGDGFATFRVGFDVTALRPADDDDGDGDGDGGAVIPTPAAAGLGAAMLALAGLRRRRA